MSVASLGPISVRLHGDTTSRSQPALLWIHGGGYVMGTATQDDALCAHLAEELGIVVAAVEYRVAPEHPFPTPLHDCFDALAWLGHQPFVDRHRIAVGGASAGGGLAAALALMSRKRGEVQPVFQLLSYPMLDDRTARRRDLDNADVRLWNAESNRFGWGSYLKSMRDADIDELASPARCHDFRGLAPAWVGVGTHDLLFEEGIAYAEAMRSGGVSCETFVVDGGFHGFDSVAPRADVTIGFRRAQVEALREALF